MKVEKPELELSEKDLLTIVESQSVSTDEQERALLALTSLYAKSKQKDKLMNTLKTWVSKRSEDQKLAVARILKNVIDRVGENDGSPKREAELEVSQFIVDWAASEKKNFLKSKMEVRLANVYYQRGELKKARDIVD